MAHFRKSNDNMPRRVIIVAFYANPNYYKKKINNDKLKLILNNLNQRYRNDAIIVTGDFNTRRYEM
jgi:hypothetical protein